MQRAIVLLTVTLLVSPLAAAVVDEDTLRGEMDTGSRSVNVGVDRGRAVVEYGRDNDSSADSLYVALDPRVGTLWVRSRDGGTTTPRAMTMRLEQLVEFADRDGDGRYTPAVDEAIRTYTPRDMQWQTLPVRNTGEGHALIGVGIFRDGGGKVAWAVETHGDYSAPDATKLTLSGLDVAFEVGGFTPSRPDAGLALVVSQRQQGVVAGLAQDAPFPWPDVVRINGVDQPASVGEGSGAHRAGATVLSMAMTADGPDKRGADSVAARAVACAMRFIC